jgi:hypothetical protein
MRRALASAGFAIVIVAALDIASATTELLASSDKPAPAPVETWPTHIPSTRIEAALDELRRRFPDRIVIGFEELFEPRPESEPQVDLGPSDATLEKVLACIRRVDPKYRVELLEGKLVHVYPATRSADPVGLLDIRLHEFFLPPDDCVLQQISNSMGHPLTGFSYTPELGAYLWQRKEAWYRAQDKMVPGVVGDFMGDCEPANHRHEPIYHNITVREALNLMAVRSLEVARGEVPSGTSSWFKPKPISWKYRFRRDPTADTGLGGVPVFQTF